MINMDNVINIGVNVPGRGISEFNTSNILLLTDEQSISGDEFGIYKGSKPVGEDYGTGSLALVGAQAVFSQNPSIKNNNGYLVVASIKPASTELLISGVPASGTFELSFGANTETFPFDSTASEVQLVANSHPGFEGVKVEKNGNNYIFTDTQSRGASIDLTVGAVTLKDASSADLTASLDNEVDGESLLEAITRLKGKVDFVGVIETFETTNAETMAVAPYIQEQNNALTRFFASGDTASLEDGGVIKAILDQNFTRSRALFKTGTDVDRLKFKCAYASQNMSVNFSQEGSTRTDHLKDLVGVSPDQNIDDQLYIKIQNAGAVCYPVIAQATAKLMSSGKNLFFDRVFNLVWFINAALVAYYNVLARTSTKIPQTEAGMISITGAIGRVCDRAVTNGYCAPGEWTSEDTFGDPETFKRNIREKGYYIYYLPLSEQDPLEREERVAPVIMVALKEAGAIHKGNVIVSINA